jgi:hypothetical protein
MFKSEPYSRRVARDDDDISEKEEHRCARLNKQIRSIIVLSCGSQKVDFAKNDVPVFNSIEAIQLIYSFLPLLLLLCLDACYNDIVIEMMLNLWC